MNDITIYTLTLLVRGFSNEVTVRGLASRLNISYSTLARCKNGKWPRSVTIDSMRSVFEECRERYFDGDGDALATSVITQLKSQDTDTAALEDSLAQGGYEAFLMQLLALAASAQSTAAAPAQTSVAQERPPADTPSSAVVAPEALAPADEEAETPLEETDAPVAEPSAVTLSFQDLLFLLPVSIILLVGLLRFSLTDFLVWANANRLAFIGLSLLIAVMPSVTSLLVDGPLAWRAWHKDHPDAKLTRASFVRVAKFGGADG